MVSGDTGILGEEHIDGVHVGEVVGELGVLGDGGVMDSAVSGNTREEARGSWPRSGRLRYSGCGSACGRR